MIGALIGVIALAAGAVDRPPEESPCQKLTGDQRTECERHLREQDPDPPKADQQEPPPPDTKSEGNEDSDTADPPQG
jgi:hypothetical protein